MTRSSCRCRCRCSLSLLLVFALTSVAWADIAALGRLEPAEGVKRISAPMVLESGNGVLLKSLEVKVGDQVAAGQLLATTESEGLLEALRHQAQANLQLKIAQSAAADAFANAECVRAAVSRREAERRNQLLERNLSSLEEAERASADAEYQEASCHASSMDAEARKAAIRLAEAELAHRQTLVSRAFVRAPSAGTVLQINAWPGEAIGSQGILELARTDRMYAIAEIYETDIAGLALNQRARITSNALPETLTGHVEFIRPVVRKQDVLGTDPAASKDARVIEVEIRLDHPEKVRDLTNLQVEVLIES